MSNSRREFLQSSAALAVGLVGNANSLAAQPQAPGPAPVPSASLLPDGAHVQIPKMKFGGAEIGRMVLGVNPFYGFAHYNNNFRRDAGVVHAGERLRGAASAASFGINAFNYVNLDRAPQDWRDSRPRAARCT